MDKGDFVFRLIRTTRHAQVYILGQWVRTEYFVLPVCATITLLDVVFVSLSILIDKRCRIGAFLTCILVLHQYILIRVHHIELVR